jgi:hypothetical protein
MPTTPAEERPTGAAAFSEAQVAEERREAGKTDDQPDSEPAADELLAEQVSESEEAAESETEGT